MVLLVLCTGCSKENQNSDKTKTSENAVYIDETNQSDTTEQRVLAMAGIPNENGYYTIDLPRSAGDLVSIERINERLYWVSVVMAQENVNSFNAVNSNLMWQTLNMEIAFNYGNTLPFKENNDGVSTEISLSDFNNFAKQCFKLDENINMESAPSSFLLNDDLVQIKYSEPKDKAFGFVMSEYKQDGKIWYIKGEIMSSGEKVFAKGEFILEENEGEAIVSHRIVSFKEE